METLHNKIEELLIGDEGIVTKIRYGEGLDKNKVLEFYNYLNLFLTEVKSKNCVYKPFFLLMLDTILVISSSVEVNEDKESLFVFLDDLTDRLRDC